MGIRPAKTRYVPHYMQVRKLRTEPLYPSTRSGSYYQIALLGDLLLPLENGQLPIRPILRCKELFWARGNGFVERTGQREQENYGAFFYRLTAEGFEYLCENAVLPSGLPHPEPLTVIEEGYRAPVGNNHDVIPSEYLLAVFGYATGSSPVECRTCAKVSVYTDIRSWRCRNCAELEWRKVEDIKTQAEARDYSFPQRALAQLEPAVASVCRTGIPVDLATLLGHMFDLPASIDRGFWIDFKGIACANDHVLSEQQLRSAGRVLIKIGFLVRDDTERFRPTPNERGVKKMPIYYKFGPNYIELLRAGD